MKDGVLGIIFNDKGDVLLLKRRDVPIWVFPGGGIDEGESTSEAVIREVFEETGLRVKVSRQIGEYTPISKLARLTYVYECQIIGGEFSTGSETRELGFYSIDKLPQNFFHIHEEWLKDALKRSTEVIRRPIEGITYWNLFVYFCRHPIRVTRVVLSRLGFPINSK